MKHGDSTPPLPTPGGLVPSQARRSFRPLGTVLALGLLLTGGGWAQTSPLTLEPTSAPRTATDAAASGGRAAALLTGGDSARFTLPGTLAPGRYTVRVRGRADLYDGAPTVALRLGGTQVGEVAVTGRGYASHTLGTLTLSGGQSLDVVFTNDAYGGTAGTDRNVYVDTLTLVREGNTAAPAPRRVMPLGDSITDGYNIPGGYRVPLLPALNAAGLPTDLVGSARNGPASIADRDHEGHSGWRIDQLLAEVDGWLASSQPDVILLMIGTNDMIQNRDVANAPARLGSLLDRIAARRPTATVLVASLPPLSDPAGNARVKAFNAALPGVVRTRAAQGRRVRLVDAPARLSLADLADGVHPNEGGYRKLAEMWLGALRGL